MAKRKRRSTRRKSRRRRGYTDWGRVGSVVAALGLVAAVVLGILYLIHDARTRKPEASCMVLVDRTGSSDDAATVASYSKLGQQAIDGCADLDAQLSLFYFDQQQAKIVNGGNPTPYNLSRVQTDQVKGALDAILQKAPGSDRGSDILEPLDQAAAELQLMGADVAGPMYLIVLSDGLHLGDSINVKSITEDPNSIQPLLAEAETLGLTPDLSNVQVDFIGTRSGRALNPGTTTVDWFEPNLERFWRALIQAGHGTVCRYGTEATELPSRC